MKQKFGTYKKPRFSSETKDMINSPPHYAEQSVECIDYIKQQLTPEGFKGYLLGNITKYLHRHTYKNGLEDLTKAQWYLDRYIKVYEEK